MWGKKKKTQFNEVATGDFAVRELNKKDWKQFRILYLQALKDDPASFSESYDEKRNIPESEWIQELETAQQDPRSIIAGLFHKPSNELVGIVLVLGNSASKLSHVAHIGGIYITQVYDTPELEKTLLQSVLKHIQQFSDINKMQVSVVTTDRDSLTLFNAFGFVRYGYDEKFIKIGRNYYDGILMTKTL